MTHGDTGGDRVDFEIVDDGEEETGFELVDAPRHGDIVPVEEEREIVLLE